jgi:hypothetical protein
VWHNLVSAGGRSCPAHSLPSRARRRAIGPHLMVYRKGEQPVPYPLDRWSSDHPLARTISSGTGWFDAWVGKKATNYVRLEKLTGIPNRRLLTISQGRRLPCRGRRVGPRMGVSANDLIASMPDPSIVVD